MSKSKYLAAGLLGLVCTLVVIGQRVTQVEPTALEAGFAANKQKGRVNEIWLYDNFYGPITLRVPPGTTVRWTNRALHRHTVTSADGLWESGPLSPGQTFSYTFTQPGTFSYYCRFHQGMRATVIVW